MTAPLVTDAKVVAKATVRFLAGTVGQELVAGVWAVMTGQTSLLLTDLGAIVSEILTTVRERLTDEELAAEIAAADTAVDVAVDAMEAARLAELAGKVPA